jgi:hypothetical protein
MFLNEENCIVAQTEELYPFRLNQVSEDQQKIEVDVDVAVDTYNCINLQDYFNYVFEQYGKGVYQLNALTHQKININGEELPSDLLIGIETQCQIKFTEDDFYITDTVNAVGYAYFTQINSGYDLDTWKGMVNENEEYSQETKNTLYELIDIIPEQVKSEYVGMNIIHQMPIWDRITVFKNLSTDA